MKQSFAAPAAGARFLLFRGAAAAAAKAGVIGSDRLSGTSTSGADIIWASLGNGQRRLGRIKEKTQGSDVIRKTTDGEAYPSGHAEADQLLFRMRSKRTGEVER